MTQQNGKRKNTDEKHLSYRKQMVITESYLATLHQGGNTSLLDMQFCLDCGFPVDGNGTDHQCQTARKAVA